MSENKKYLDINDIKQYLPHRYPFLLVDRVLEWSDKAVTAIKNVSANEEFFNGHFPSSPVMPGVLIVEAVAQAASFLAYNDVMAAGGSANLEIFFMGIDNAKFRKPVLPGDQLLIKVEFVKKRRDYWWMSGTASVDGETVFEAEMSAVMRIK